MSLINKSSLVTSVAQDAYLIIGQYFVLTLTLTSDKNINDTLQVIFNKNINIDRTTTDDLIFTKIKGQKDKYTCDIMLSVNSNLQEKDTITFDINLSETIDGVSQLHFKCTATLINPDSLGLSFTEVFLDTPNENNKNTKIKTKVFTTLIDKHGNKLPNVPIYIDSSISKNLASCTIHDSTDEIPISMKKINAYDGLFIQSDSEGNVAFYIYPEQSLSMILILRASIIGVFDFIPATSPLFIVNADKPNPMDSLREPDILGGFPGPLTSDTGESNFYVSIDNYEGNEAGDYILFFTKKLQDIKSEYCGHYVRVGDTSTELGQGVYSYTLPYYIFDIGVSYEFSYKVIFGKGTGSKASLAIPVTYMGGAKYYPPKVKREYDSCKVYTSLGVGVAEIPSDTVIGYDNIKKYLDNPHKDTGLFIEIDGANNQKGKVPLGYNVTLNMYINASGYSVQKSWTQLMPTTVNSDNIAVWSYNIPYDLLVGLEGNVYFDYEFNIGNDKLYGEIWKSQIDTRPE
ncbi:hypothetical protein PSI19_02450 [Xenorhabdus khoisanae]|uniref:hypothetical protein n=1 Tax=Xenorhabdus khoisanae TaxID=880157 RepID=UPI00235A0D01|nr:hypothetical protein [Xenorhabdus khoisanae]MDC9612759.1 hypothetical protein [Xenorhabdus khoisanae]